MDMLCFSMYSVFFFILCFATLAHAATYTTDSTEVKLLKIFHDKIVGNGPAIWNFSVDPCSGLEGWGNYQPAEEFKPASGVECELHNDTKTYHIKRISIVSMNVAGQIAPEIGNFTYLKDINLAQNMITGSLPKEIFKLNRTQYLSLARNKLSGTIPPEIGNLSAIISIGLSSNNFTGTLPEEMGKLATLNEVYFDDNGFEGAIPASFSQLTSLRIIEGHNNKLNGSIPDIFSKLTNLHTLFIYGNMFQGQIPPTLWNVTTLKYVYMDGSGEFSNLSFPSSLANLQALNELSFRHCGLTGTIPSQLGELGNLTYLDLSFNNLTGGIPSTFGSMKNLEKLFLGNNNLTGTLPTELSNLTKLKYIDLSYNQLSGSIPTWLSTSSLQANLIWNSFDASNSNGASSTLFNCLDSKSPCTRTRSGKNVKFKINCGGTKENSYYDDSSSNLEYTNIKIHSSKRWAVSTIGYVRNDEYEYTTSTTETNLPIIYQTARASPSSLRYFGLNMVNGNYTLELHFAEISISSNNSEWKSNGKRLFDIYVQGEKIYENYDIVTRANGSFKVLVEKRIVQVTNNFLEVHLKWSEKGTCCVPKRRTFGPLISAIVVSPEFDYSSTSLATKIGISIGAIGAFFVICLLVFLYYRKRRMLIIAKQEIYEDLQSIEYKPNIFTYQELKAATNGFHSQNKLGEGGFGVVYKGVLADGTIVAVKQLAFKADRQEFLNEVAVISSVKHRNLVKLLGCCFEGSHRILVLEFLENNDLRQALLGPLQSRLDIDWQTRYNICIEIARGLMYLHEESLPRIIHRDIKASNILLDKNLNPKIADFGLAKLFVDEKTHISTVVAGTIGYLSPEYATRGQLSEKLDVYSFGILVLEIISGRCNVDSSQPIEKTYLLEWVKHSRKANVALEVIDPTLQGKYSKEEAMKIIELALRCVQTSPNKRPTMSEVVNTLTESVSADFLVDTSYQESKEDIIKK